MTREYLLNKYIKYGEKWQVKFLKREFKGI